jgi:hypothetical protein
MCEWWANKGLEPTVYSVRSCLAPAFGSGSGPALGLEQQFKGGEPVKDHFTAVLKNTGDWWIGWIEEVPGVNCQERSKEALIETLRITLREALDFNRREALEAAGESYEEQGIAL